MRLKPLAKIRRRPFLVRRSQAVLSRALEQLLFDHADVLSEGGLRVAGSHGTYFGSTMISIAFARIESEVSLARAEAARRVRDGTLGTAVCDVRVRDDGKHLHIDVDLEAEVRVSFRAKRS
jgi:hypothetical protein